MRKDSASNIRRILKAIPYVDLDQEQLDEIVQAVSQEFWEGYQKGVFDAEFFGVTYQECVEKDKEMDSE